MTFKKTSPISHAIIDEITNSFKKRLTNNEFRHDYEHVKKISFPRPSHSQTSRNNDNKAILEQATDTQGPINDQIENLQKDYTLNHLYRRFVSPRKILGRIIDHLKNKFYYETHHFIGAIVDKQEQINKNSAETIFQLSQRLEHLTKSHSHQQNKLAQKIQTLQQSFDQLNDDFQKSQALIEQNETRTTNILDSLLTYVSAVRRKVDNIKSELSSHQDRSEQVDSKFEFLSAAINSIGESIDTLTSSIDQRIHQLKYPQLDFNYVDFEKTFYGDHESLQNKHSQYLKYLRGCKKVVDIGCGSGAFLELLKHNDIMAIGVDANPNVVKDASNNGHKVINKDAITYLQSQSNGALDAISSFHMIEHLHPEDWLKFFQLSYQKLKPQGKLLVETPNNNMLGIFNKGFYMDPTHIRPVHPQTIEFVLKDLGFSNIEIFTSSPLPDGDRLQGVSDSAMNQNIQKLNQTLFGHQDLSIIATK